jgi:hypothetical protein
VNQQLERTLKKKDVYEVELYIITGKWQKGRRGL